jgi:hypothetical protein
LFNLRNLPKLLGNIKIPKFYKIFSSIRIFPECPKSFGHKLNFFFNLYHLPESVVRNKISKAAQFSLHNLESPSMWRFNIGIKLTPSKYFIYRLCVNITKRLILFLIF